MLPSHNLAMFMALAGSTMKGGLPIIKVKEKEWRPCLLKGCEHGTIHNGGYCSAECCKLDRIKS